MKRVFLILTVFLLFQISAFAQTENLPCPKISVAGPSGVIDAESDSPATYTASVENSENLQIEYLWETTAGRIIAGQGTHTIELDVRDTGNLNITVTVEIKGLPETCPNTDSETQVVSKREPHNCLPYGNVPKSGEFLKLDQLTIRLRQNPDISSVLRLYFKKNPTQKQINSRISRITKHFAFRKAAVLLDRVTFVIIENDDEYMRICYFPKDKEETYCDDCKIIKGADVDLSKLTKSKKPRK